MYTKKGLPDLHIVVNGINIDVEVKAPNGKASKLQKHNVVQINQSGSIAMVLFPDGFDHFKKIVEGGDSMRVSHSRIECFEGCPFRYKMRYIEGIQTLKPDEADNALSLGTALHTGFEKGVNVAIKEYFMNYPVITDEHINEAMKLEVMIPKVAQKIPKGQFEVEISDDDFKGFIMVNQYRLIIKIKNIKKQKTR